MSRKKSVSSYKVLSADVDIQVDDELISAEDNNIFTHAIDFIEDHSPDEFEDQVISIARLKDTIKNVSKITSKNMSSEQEEKIFKCGFSYGFNAKVLQDIEDLKEKLLNKNIIIYDVKEIEKKIGEIELIYGDKESQTRVKRTFNEMIKNGGVRNIGVIDISYKEKVKKLKEDFPNFIKVVDFFEGMLSLALLNNGIITNRPILLNGTPGVGKTSFANRIADILNTSFYVIPIATADSAFYLSGSESYYSNSKPGKIFDALVFGDYINPTILVDEIDKVNNNSGNQSSTSALYSLLEKDTAKNFKDNSIDVAIDCSKINWIFTSNEIDNIPDPILQRLTIFNIPKLNKEQTKHIIKNIYSEFIKNNLWGKAFDESISDVLLEDISVMAPREIKSALLNAFGIAAVSERSFLIIDDFKINKKEEKRKIGF